MPVPDSMDSESNGSDGQPEVPYSIISRRQSLASIHAKSSKSLSIPTSIVPAHSLMAIEQRDLGDGISPHLAPALECDGVLDDGNTIQDLTRLSKEESAAFLKKRAVIEEEYAKSICKLSTSAIDGKNTQEGKDGTYGDAWIQFCRMHEQIGEVHATLARNISQQAEALTA
ncbi:hypothetical protein HK096_000169, partial [Nowakowskiella sp. JEL0078]